MHQVHQVLRGGVNAKQVGLGSQLAAIDTIHSTGSLQTTGRTLRLSNFRRWILYGSGCIQVTSCRRSRILGSFENTIYTRAGNFYMDSNGYLSKW